MRSQSQRSERPPDERRQARKAAEAGADEAARAPWIAPALEELPPLGDTVMQGSPIEGGGNIGDNPFG